jgi:hypothetical protein
MKTQPTYTYQERIDAIADYVPQDVKEAFAKACIAITELQVACKKAEDEGNDPTSPIHGDMLVMCFLQIDNEKEGKCVTVQFVNGNYNPLQAQAMSLAITGEFL